MTFAPVIIFTYNRLHHLTRTVESLAENTLAADTEVIFYSDGPKAGEEERVGEVRKYLQGVKGFKSIRIIEREKNFGLGKSIIQGVSEMLTLYERVIVLEDDLVTSPYFLKFMNDALEIYSQDEEVISVAGYNYPIEVKNQTYFLNNADCLGWGTWSRAWKYFNPDALALKNDIDRLGLKKRFNIDNSYPYYKLLNKVVEGKNSSWAVRWYACALLNNKYSLYPGKSLVLHIGNDEGTNMKASSFLLTELWNQPVEVKRMPVKEDPQARKALAAYFRKNVSYWGVLKNKLKFYFSRKS